MTGEAGPTTEMLEMYSSMYGAMGKFTTTVRQILTGMMGMPSSDIPGYLE